MDLKRREIVGYFTDILYIFSCQLLHTFELNTIKIARSRDELFIVALTVSNYS